MLDQLKHLPFSTLFESSLDGVVVMDEDHRYLYANPAALRMSGYTLEEALKRNLFMDVAPRWRETIERLIAEDRASSEEHPPKPGVGHLLRANGEEFEIEYVATPFVIEGFRFAVVMFRDMTEARRLTRNAQALAQIASTVAVAGSLGETLDALARRVVEATGTVHCGLFLIDENEITGGAECIRVYGEYGGKDECGEADAKAEREAWESAVRAGAPAPGYEAVETGRPVVIENFSAVLLADPRFTPVHDHIRQHPGMTLVSLPMRYGHSTIGWMNVCYEPGRRPNEDDIAFLSTIADQATIAAENARLLVEAREKAALEERQRLARELHDSVSQALYGIALGARTARTLIDRDPTQAVEPLDYVLSLAEAGLAEMRALIFELRPESLREEGLIAALAKQIEFVRARHKIAVDATLPGEPAVPFEVKEAVYRIAQEALTNTIKHARASQVALELNGGPRELILEVSDNGVGFEAANGPIPGHLGLRSMQERAATLGGTVNVESAPARGTRVRVRIPVPA
ncbi:MAG TPA: histidine kinase [bacterium]|nr:histidine kinase [bacterium]